MHIGSVIGSALRDGAQVLRRLRLDACICAHAWPPRSSRSRRVMVVWFVELEGAPVAVDPRSGETLALVSLPAYLWLD